MDRVERLWVCWLFAAAVLCGRLLHLQVLRGAYYRGLAEQNRLRLVPEPAPRGLILDRYDRPLASSQTLYRVTLVPQEVENLSAVLTRVSGVVGRAPETLLQEYRKEQTLAFLPATIVSRVPKEIALGLEEERWRLPGLLVKPEAVRSYPMGQTAAHVLGYLSQPTAEELPLLKRYGVRPRELVGHTGIEQLLDHALRGQPGGMLVEVNHRGRQVRVLGRRIPQPGAPVKLTLDANLQSLIEASFGAQAGACVVLNPWTGEVLAMVSQPGFDPGVFSALDNQAIRRLLNDPASPLMNRAAVGVYQPGSIAKLVTAAAALEHRVISPATTVTCPGSVTIGDRTFHCWNRDGHGLLNLPEALMQSCNVYFIQLGRKLGAERLRVAFEQIGFARRTGWSMEEQPGHVPRRRLTEGEVGLLAIGQSELLVTTLQAAVMASVFANGGLLVEPWVVTSVDGHPSSHHLTQRRLGWSVDTIDVVRAGMWSVVNDPSGTGRHAASSRVTIAGKTGTAQTHVPGRTHGWFVGFCPVAEPRLAVAIVAEFGGSGGELPAEIARTMCEYIVEASSSPNGA